SDRSLQSAARLDSPRVRPDHHGQCRPCQRFGGKCQARNRHRQCRRKHFPASGRGILREVKEAALIQYRIALASARCAGKTKLLLNYCRATFSCETKTGSTPKSAPS